jgi:glycosyltransferase involved in cell wall biosynthesis
MKLAILTSHPVQYYAPLFRELASRVDLHVFYAHNATPQQQAEAGFGHAFAWDVDLTSGFAHSFLPNVAARAGTDHFWGCDTPSIGAMLKAGGFNAVLSLGWHLKSLVQGILAAKRLGLPVMVRGDSHLGTQRSALKTFTKAVTYPGLLRVFNAALYPGKATRAYFEYYGYPAERLFHSPHCVDTARFAKGASREARANLWDSLGIGVDEPIVLFAGKLVAFKRPLDVVEAVALIRANGIPAHVMVAGSGELEHEMTALAKALGVPLHHLGFQNQSQMPAAYAASAILALPSTARETWGLVCNEAIACGTPIVVSDQVGCAPDLASDSNVGRVFPMGDISAFAGALTAALNNPPNPAAIRDLSERYSVSAAVDGIVAALQHLKTSNGVVLR